MRCDTCGSPARNAPIDGDGPVRCVDCTDDDDEQQTTDATASASPDQQTLADHGGSGQTSLAGFRD